MESDLTDAPDSLTKPFQCTSCPKSFTFKSSLKYHIRSKHTEEECKSSYSCTICLDSKQLVKSFRTQHRLREHMTNVHGPPRFKCLVCFKTFSNTSDFHKHQKTHTQKKEARHKCELCSQILSCKKTLKKHLFGIHNQKSEGVKYFACEICPLEFAGRSYLESHILTKHVVDKECECVVCSEKFVDEETLEKHMTQHDKKIQYLCDICCKDFKFKKHLICHLGVVHLKFFYCNKCKRSYGNKSEFDQHLNPETTSGLKLRFHCQMCRESFHSQCNLDIHTNSHLTEIKETSNDDIKNEADTKPVRPSIAMPNLTQEFRCELCSKSFDRQTYLAAHRNQVHGNAEWKCSFQQCCKTFKKWNELRRHKLTHTGTKRFACTVCGKAFYFMWQLKKHEWSHVKDKKHKCKMCPKSFAAPCKLRVHVANNHGGPKPFECPVNNCGTSWADNCQLKRHLVSHETEGSFKCDMCTTIKAFKSLRQLKTHKHRVHSDTTKTLEGNKLKKQINSKIRKHSDALVLICCLNNCSFETVDEKNVALHYNLKHGLPKVLISPNCLSPSSVLEKTRKFEIKRLIQKRYKCRICSAYSKTSSQFAQHQRTHSSETPFKCPQCSTRFKYQGSLIRHIRQRHNKKRRK